MKLPSEAVLIIFVCLGRCSNCIDWNLKFFVGDCCSVSSLTGENPKDSRTLTPWHAGLFQKEGEQGTWKYLLSGSVIGPSTVLTVGSRFWENVDNNWQLNIPNGKHLLLAVGLTSTNLDEQDAYSQTSEVTYVQPHTRFNAKTRIHDIAIIHLKNPLNLASPYAQAAELPIESNPEFFSAGSTAIHGGFDWQTRSDGFRNFKVTNITMLTYESCLEAFRYLEAETPFYLYCARVLSPNSAKGWIHFMQNPLLPGAVSTSRDQNNLCLFYGSTPVIKIGTKYRIVGMNSVFTFNGANGSCNRNSVNWFSPLNGSIPWIRNTMACGSNHWSCGNGDCIGIDKVCDRKSDCPNNRDEEPVYCRGLNPCSVDEFGCGAYDACISKSSVCDFKVDCPNGEDEDPGGICAGEYSISTSRGCSAIEQTEGVKIECEEKETKSSVNCSSRRHVNFGVRAKLSCEKYYISSVNKPAVTRHCGQNGLWTPAISFGCYPDCGRAERALNLLIVNGSLSSRDEWPWHVAIFRFSQEDEVYSYVCGGSLIHRTGVLTAAHCFLSEEFTFFEASMFKVVLAPKSSVYQENLADRHSQVMDISDRYIPETFNTRDFRSDIAIIQLSNSVTFNDFIRPVCFPTYSNAEHKALAHFQLSPNSFGQVIGFGVDESLGISNFLRFANLPVVSTMDCFEQLKKTPGEDTYCAGYTNGTSVCNGDSGCGMVFQGGTGISPRYYVQGIVSQAQKQEHSRLCNSHSYAIFTRVGFFSDWIEQQIQQLDLL